MCYACTDDNRRIKTDMTKASFENCFYLQCFNTKRTIIVNFRKDLGKASFKNCFSFSLVNVMQTNVIKASFKICF